MRISKSLLLTVCFTLKNFLVFFLSVHRYSLSIKPSTDGVDKPYVLRWNFQVIDDSITSDSPRKFVIDPTKGKPQKDVQIVVQSNKPRTIEELKNMISLEAVDQESGQLLLLDGQPIFVPTLKKKKDSGDGEKEGLVPSLGGDKKDPGFEPISVVVSPPKSKCCVKTFHFALNQLGGNQLFYSPFVPCPILITIFKK